MRPRFPLVSVGLLLAYWLGRRNGWTEGQLETLQAESERRARDWAATP